MRFSNQSIFAYLLKKCILSVALWAGVVDTTLAQDIQNPEKYADHRWPG